MKEGFNPQAHNYEISPLFVRTGQKTMIKIRQLVKHCVKFEPEMRLFLTGCESVGGEGPEQVPFKIDADGSLQIKIYAKAEQEYALVLCPTNEMRRLVEFRFYALGKDMQGLLPFKGDFHLHSTSSDGQEEPSIVVAAGRKAGMDFLALTDHHKYEPSLEAIEKFKKLPLDIRLYPGEEVHPPDNPVHMINFGGRYSVNKLFKTEQETYDKEVKKLKNSMRKLPKSENAIRVASTEWCLRKIDEAGGIGIFCHPYWFRSSGNYSRYHIAPELAEYVLNNCSYTALELLGGYYRWQNSNNLQTAWFNSGKWRREVPVIGASDAHSSKGDALLGWYFTIVFSETHELADLKKNIKELRSVAVETIPGEIPRIYGPFRLVKVAHFLLREYFPMHDRLCHVEGELMQQFVMGNPRAANALKALSGTIPALQKKFWRS